MFFISHFITLWYGSFSLQNINKKTVVKVNIRELRKAGRSTLMMQVERETWNVERRTLLERFLYLNIPMSTCASTHMTHDALYSPRQRRGLFHQR